MAPVSLFEVDGAYGVLAADELDGGDVTVLFEYDPLRVPLASRRPQGKLRRGPGRSRWGSSIRQLQPAPLQAWLFAVGWSGPARCGKKPEQERPGGKSSRKNEMETSEVEYLKERVSCAAVLEKSGFAVDVKESTRRAVKHRRGDDIVIVIHDGKGWFDPMSDAKGDVFSLIRHLDGGNFAEVLATAAELVDFTPAEPAWTREPREQEPAAPLSERWRNRRAPWSGSATWRYLGDGRALPETIIRAAIRQDWLREGPRGSVWAAHVDDAGTVTGWEERGPEWRGFSTGGSKVLFRLGALDGLRLRDRSGDRCDEPRCPRGAAGGQPLSQHRRRLVAGNGGCGAGARGTPRCAARCCDRRQRAGRDLRCPPSDHL